MKQFLIFCTALLLVCGCKDKTAKNAARTGADSVATVSVDTLLPDSLFFMLQDKPLSRSIDLKQDISRLSYSCLRLLRSYVYATHGHWFVEGELHHFFQNHTQWYDSLCYATWCNPDVPYDSLPQKNRDYITTLWDDYPKSYGLIELSAEERALVESIDKRMAEMEKSKYIFSRNEEKLLNPMLAVNWFQMFQPDSSFARRLMENNIALQPAKYLQLFNVYEVNDYYNIPNFITTDVMLQLYHIYFSYVLKSLEGDLLMKTIREAFWQMLLECHTRLSVCPEMRICHDMNSAVYCLVGLKLLGYDVLDRPELDGLKEWLEGRPMETFEREVKLVEAAEDALSPLFDTGVYFPYSLFKPRGHYTRNEASMRYFRAMMWLQRGCFKREVPDQLEQAISMASLLNDAPAAYEHLRKADRTIRFLIGESDNVSILDLAIYMREQKFTGNEVFLDKKAVAQIDEWLKEQFKIHNRIRPKVAATPPDELNLLPGRYVFDNEILGTLYDPKVDAPRAYPSGLDVMDVLGVETATDLLQERNSQQPWGDYKKERQKQVDHMRQLSGWDNTIYDKWMHTLVKLQQPDKQQPLFMQTRAWKLKNLNTSLASWAQLKHDAVLYAEQPMAAECGGGGEFPDPEVLGYVEPNLPFWKELESMLALTQKMLERNGFLTEKLKHYGEVIASNVKFCREVAEKELAGKNLDVIDYETIRCMGSSLEWLTLGLIDPDNVYSSWYDVKGPDRCVAQVSDVFTRNIMDCPKDGILYEATGLPNDIYVVVEMKGRHYITRGSVYSYYEFVRPMGDRLTDEQWQDMLFKGHAPDVPEWFAPLLMRDTSVSPDERFIYSTGC